MSLSLVSLPRRLPGALTVLLLSLASLQPVQAQPTGGDVFREYRWTNAAGDAGGSLRVGGKLDYGGGPIAWSQSFDLQDAIQAEVVIEKLLCHDGTRGLAISVNDNPWITLPESLGIARPQWDYQHHTYPVVTVPLEQLRNGENQFRLRVAQEHPWDWPQNLIYGVHCRVYYDSTKKPHARGKVVLPDSSDAIGRHETLRVAADSANQGTIEQVDFLGLYEDVNLEGDGQYRQWHYYYVQARLRGHIGTVKNAPWELTWDTSWVPDQPKPLELAARITDAQGVIYQTESLTGLTLDRDELSVELCKPYDVPKKWVTRSGAHTEKFRIAGDLKKAVAARLVWCSWSPGYMEGLLINDRQVMLREGPRYAYHVHRVPLGDLSILKPGENRLTTGKTPKYDGKMVHGMEVNWPGIMVLIQYRQ